MMLCVGEHVLDPWHFARLLTSAQYLPHREEELTYIPAISPTNTVFKQAIAAVILLR